MIRKEFVSPTVTPSQPYISAPIAAPAPVMVPPAAPVYTGCPPVYTQECCYPMYDPCCYPMLYDPCCYPMMHDPCCYPLYNPCCVPVNPCC